MFVRLLCDPYATCLCYVGVLVLASPGHSAAGAQREIRVAALRPHQCHDAATSMKVPLLCLQSSEGTFTMSRENKSVRRSFCRHRSCTLTEVARLVPPGNISYALCAPPCTQLRRALLEARGRASVVSESRKLSPGGPKQSCTPSFWRREAAIPGLRRSILARRDAEPLFS